MAKPWGSIGFGWILAVLVVVESFLMLLHVVPVTELTVAIGLLFLALAILL